MSEIPYDWAHVACPVCHQPAKNRCRTKTTGRVTDAHSARLQLAYPRNPLDSSLPNWVDQIHDASGMDEYHPDTTHTMKETL